MLSRERMHCALTVCGMFLVWTNAARAQNSQTKMWKSVGETSFSQKGGSWQIDLSLQNQSSAVSVLAFENVKIEIAAAVSNSRVKGHDREKKCCLKFKEAKNPEDKPFGLYFSAADQVIDAKEAKEEIDRCQMLGTVHLWKQESNWASKKPVLLPGEKLRVDYGEKIHVCISLSHQHPIYGNYELLLGSYKVKIKLGAESAYDHTFEMRKEQYLAQPKVVLVTPPPERLDQAEDKKDKPPGKNNKSFLGTSPALHLQAHIPGQHYYRFKECEVRSSTRMKLSFRYFVARGTEGECKVKIAQYKDTPSTWKRLNDGGWEECLTERGHWEKVEHFFWTEPEATTVALEFNIVGDTDIGEMWIQDCKLEVAHYSPPAETP